MVLRALIRGNHVLKMRKGKTDRTNVLLKLIKSHSTLTIMKKCQAQRKIKKIKRNNASQSIRRIKGTIRTQKQGKLPLRIQSITPLLPRVHLNDSQITNNLKTNKRSIIEVIWLQSKNIKNWVKNWPICSSISTTAKSSKTSNLNTRTS